MNGQLGGMLQRVGGVVLLLYHVIIKYASCPWPNFNILWLVY